MVQKKITQAMIDKICRNLKYYDEHRRLPSRKVRIDITLSPEAIEKIKKHKNRSKYINNLILSQ